MEAGGLSYLCDSYADDLPYWIKASGSEPHLVIPYTLDANDMRFVNPQGFGGGEEFFTYLKDSFDVLYAEGGTAPKMMSVGLHCRLVGRPGRAGALMGFLDYIAKHEARLGADAARDRAALARQHEASGGRRVRYRVGGATRQLTPRPWRCCRTCASAAAKPQLVPSVILT